MNHDQSWADLARKEQIERDKELEFIDLVVCYILLIGLIIFKIILG